MKWMDRIEKVTLVVAWVIATLIVVLMTAMPVDAADRETKTPFVDKVVQLAFGAPVLEPVNEVQTSLPDYDLFEGCVGRAVVGGMICEGMSNLPWGSIPYDCKARFQYAFSVCYHYYGRPPKLMGGQNSEPPEK